MSKKRASPSLQPQAAVLPSMITRASQETNSPYWHLTKANPRLQVMVLATKSRPLWTSRWFVLLACATLHQSHIPATTKEAMSTLTSTMHRDSSSQPPAIFLLCPTLFTLPPPSEAATSKCTSKHTKASCLHGSPPISSVDKSCPLRLRTRPMAKLHAHRVWGYWKYELY